MSRRHLVDWTCDRCGKTVTTPGKSDTNEPEGWSTVTTMDETYVRADLCDSCTQAYRELLAGFLAQFMASGKAIDG